MGRLVSKEGAHAVVADSPGGGYRYTAKILGDIYRTSGMLEAAQQAGIEVNWDTTSRPVSFADGMLTKHFDIITPVVEADGLINLCKMKTHLFTVMTGAVKNLFGVIPGLIKTGYHAKLHDTMRFASMLLDLASYIAPRLTIMDASWTLLLQWRATDPGPVIQGRSACCWERKTPWPWTWWPAK